MNHRRLLIKYINHVGISEGTTFLQDHDREAWPDSVEFTDEEWAALQELNGIDFEALAHHSCSCHMKNAGPCDICKVLGCEVWDFNQVVYADNVPMDILSRSKEESDVAKEDPSDPDS